MALVVVVSIWGGVDGRGGLDYDWGGLNVGGRSGGGVVYHGVETVVVVSGVFHGSDGTVGLHKGVGALHDVTVTDLLLLLVVTGVTVSYGVIVLVLWVRLRNKLFYLVCKIRNETLIRLSKFLFLYIETTV